MDGSVEQYKSAGGPIHTGGLPASPAHHPSYACTSCVLSAELCQELRGAYKSLPVFPHSEPWPFFAAFALCGPNYCWAHTIAVLYCAEAVEAKGTVVSATATAESGTVAKYPRHSEQPTDCIGWHQRPQCVGVRSKTIGCHCHSHSHCHVHCHCHCHRHVHCHRTHGGNRGAVFPPLRFNAFCIVHCLTGPHLSATKYP